MRTDREARRAERAARRTTQRQSPWSTFVWGAILLTAGVVFWLDRMGRLDARDWLEWWPVAIVAAGLAYLPQRRWFAALFTILIGAYFLLPMLGYSELAVWKIVALWPLLITVAGVMLVLQTVRQRGPGTRFRAIAVMAGNNVSLGSQDVAGGQAVAVMGGCEIDLSEARSNGGETEIDVLAFWGGIEIRVPRGWTVIDRVAPILGGFEDSTSPADPNAPRVIVRGASIMGGVEVTNAGEGSA